MAISTIPESEPNAAEVILPLPLRSSFNYRLLPQYPKIPAVGKRVLVHFGKTKLYAGVIGKLYYEVNQEALQRLRPIDEVLDESPVLTSNQLELYHWLAGYYLCSVGDVLKASLPVGLKLSSETEVVAGPAFATEWPDTLPDRELLLLEAVQVQGSLTISEAADVLELKQPRPILKRLVELGLVQFSEAVEANYRPKLRRCLGLAPVWQAREHLSQAFDLLKRSAKQEAVLMLVAEAFFKGQLIAEKELLERLQVTGAVIKGVIDKGIIEVVEVPVDRLGEISYHPRREPLTLNPEQEIAYKLIQASLDEAPKRPILLHGITGSGKTHIYITLLKECLALGQQALYLLPEIALTKQIIDKVRAGFPDAVGVYHSRFSPSERVEIWQKVLQGQYQIVIGVRSAIMLPFEKLGLIVVDEEHDSSFKQFEPAPRYNARDVAVYYGNHFGCPVILGSATPSLETYQNAVMGKYKLIELTSRAHKGLLPQIDIIDMRSQGKHQLSHGQFSDVLVKALKETLARGEQIILFKNRRGFSPLLVCNHCGHVPQCPNCDISLTFHKQPAYLRCHYCGYTDHITEQCTVCSQYDMRREGIGTERLEEQLQELLPEALIGRMDLDTTRGKQAYQNLIARFERHELDVLVGTQMVTKGLDFEKVTLAAVVQADQTLAYPDFRAHEYAYQLLTQFAGRSGRSERPGSVLIQTRSPQHPVLQLLQTPYLTFYTTEMALREVLLYPPFSRLIRLELRHRQKDFLEQEASHFAEGLRKVFGPGILGPSYPLLPRLRTLYRQHILIRMPHNGAVNHIKSTLLKEIKHYYHQAERKTLQVVVDVDPR